jgi:hypothetical protein
METRQISGVDLWFSVAATTNVGVQIRETTVGFPNQTVLAETVIAPSAIILGGNSTRILFGSPITLLAGTEYSVVVLCNDANGALSVAEIGKFDSNAQKFITDQPYSIGVLLSSSNASTWTAHQEKDLTFALLASSYLSSNRTIALGNVAVTSATDLLLLAYADRPDGATSVNYTLTLPDASVITVGDGQPVVLPAPITGNIAVAAQLIGNTNFSPVLHPGSQLIVGSIASSGTYVTRAIPAGTSVSVKVIYEAVIPSGATVLVQYKGPDGGDTFATVTQTATRLVDGGFTEFTHYLAGITEATVQIKLTLTGTTAAHWAG